MIFGIERGGGFDVGLDQTPGMDRRAPSIVFSSVLLFGALLSGCPAPLCTPGASEACACSSGAEGAQVCREDGSGYEECQCEDPGPSVEPPDAGGGDDAGTLEDGGVVETDAGTTEDSGTQLDGNRPKADGWHRSALADSSNA